jgi:hypothetical protein
MIAGLLASLLLLSGPEALAAESRRVAVVIGVGDYASLPDALDLPSAADDARHVAEILEKEAGYDRVHLLVGPEATRQAILDLLGKTLAPKINPKDTLLVFFVGHGMGADFDDPYLLPYDTDPNRVQDTALGVKPFASMVRRALNPGLFVLVTDAVHTGNLNGLALVGPHAGSWPSMNTHDWFVLSSTTRGETRSAPSFARYVAEGLKGAADANSDKLVSPTELHRYVHDEVARESGDRTHPMEGGSFKPADTLAWPGQARATASLGGAAVEMDDAGRLSESQQKMMRYAGYGSLGAAAVLAGTGGIFYGRTKALQPKYFGTKAWDEGETWPEVRDGYKSAYTVYRGLLIGAGVFAAAGGTLLLVPTAEGPGLGFAGHF